MLKYARLFLKLTISLALVSVTAAAADSPIPNLEKYAFTSQNDGLHQGPRTDALIIKKDGKVIFSKYDRGHETTTKHILWSASKSMVSLLFAIAEYRGLASREDSICKHDPSIAKEKCDIRYLNLLQYTTGLRWVEEYEKTNRPQSASILAMNYGEGRKDIKQFVLNHEFVAKPGELWRYSSGDTAVLTALIPLIFKSPSIHDVFDKELFGPLGITDWTLPVDEKGQGFGASDLYMRAEDVLKIGDLLLAGGQWGGKRLFAKSWIDFIITRPAAFDRNRADYKSDHVCGGGFWMNNVEGIDLPAPWPQAPKDAFAALGHWGQFFVVIPSMKLVAVRIGDTRTKEHFTIDGMMETLMKDLN